MTGVQTCALPISIVMKKTELIIHGMHCSSCAMINERTLGVVDGIISVNVDIKSKLATIEYDDSKIDVDKIIKAINNQIHHKLFFCVLSVQQD